MKCTKCSRIKDMTTAALFAKQVFPKFGTPWITLLN